MLQHCTITNLIVSAMYCSNYDHDKISRNDFLCGPTGLRQLPLVAAA